MLEKAWGNVEFTVDPVASSLLTGAAHAKAVGLLPGDTADLKKVYDLAPLNALLKADGKDPVAGP